jgi:succinate dehydrogenase / fumarate reductase iron-sulfur subunit
MDIRKNPVTVEGKQTTPPVWDMSCLEQVCGICTMIIDGRVRQSCSALIDDLCSNRAAIR